MVKGPTLDLSSGHDLEVVSSSPVLSSSLTAQSLEPVLDSVSLSLFLSLSAPPPPALCVSFKNK